MSSPTSSQRVLTPTLFACMLAIIYGCSEAGGAATAGNPITGEGLPNPAPTMTKNWGKLPEGRMWGSSAGIDIDPTDGNVWAYERCGAGALRPTTGSVATPTLSIRSSSSTATRARCSRTSARESW